MADPETPTSPENPASDVPKAKDRSLFGWYGDTDKKTRRVFWTCGAGWVMDAADSQVYQYLIPLLIVSLGITLTEATSIASASFFAAAIGGWVGGWLCDRYGRARILQLTILWFSVFSFASGFAQNFEQMMVIRILHGFGFGAEWAVGAVLLGEMIKPEHRGKALGAVQSGAPIGSGIAAILAGPVAAYFDPDLGWRFAFWVGLLPALLIFFIRKGSDDAEVYKKAKERQIAKKQQTAIWDIFAAKMWKITTLASMLSLGVQIAAYSVAGFITTLFFQERGIPLATVGILVLLNSAGGFFGCLVNSYISDIAGRRVVFRLFGLGFLIMASIYLFGPWGTNLWILVPVGMIYGFFQFGMYASFGPYFTELFPTETRGSGQAFAYNSGRAGAAIFILGVPIAANTIPLDTAMAVFAIAGVLLALVATLLLPETAGRALISLDDMDQEKTET